MFDSAIARDPSGKSLFSDPVDCKSFFSMSALAKGGFPDGPLVCEVKGIDPGIYEGSVLF
jgi:hypothetical protein